MTISLAKLTMLLAAVAAAYLACGLDAPRAREDEQTPCTEDAMLVFDASGSMG